MVDARLFLSILLSSLRGNRDHSVGEKNTQALNMGQRLSRDL